MKDCLTMFSDDLLNAKGRVTFGEDFNPETFIDEFVQRKDPQVCPSTYHLNSNLTSKNFARATDIPEIGKEYKVMMVPTQKDCLIDSQGILDFMKTIPGIKFFGAQGQLYLQEQQPYIFPIEKCTFSFDKKNNLWKDAVGEHRVPKMFQYSNGTWSFSLDYLKFPFDYGNVLVCFCELNQREN